MKAGLVSMIPQRTLTSGGQWTVTLEKSQASDHDVLSIFGHKQGTNHDQYVPGFPHPTSRSASFSL